MAKLLEEWKEDLVEALTEHDLLLGSKHQKIEHAVLLVRNIAVGAALVLFIASLLHAPMEALLKGSRISFGAAAYFCEIVLLTDCFTAKGAAQGSCSWPIASGPMYILLGLSYLLGH